MKVYETVFSGATFKQTYFITAKDFNSAAVKAEKLLKQLATGYTVPIYTESLTLKGDVA